MTTKQVNPPTLSDVLDNVKRDTQITLNAIKIGIIQSFDETNQTATVRMAIKQVINIEPDGTRVFKEHPLVLECPVVTLFGGDAFLSMPIKAGDNCLVFVCDREIDNWLYNGGVQAPSTGRVHDISDAIALVGVRNFQNSIADYITNGIRISFAENSRIDLKDDAINSIAALFTHTGNFLINGNLEVDGDSLTTGNSTTEGDSTTQGNHGIAGNMTVGGVVTGGGGGAFTLGANLDANGNNISGGILASSNGATGTFSSVTVVNGIVTGGS